MHRYGRRRFLCATGVLGAGALSAALSGCATGSPRRGAASTSSTTAPAPSTTLALDPGAWSDLASSLTGRLVLPSSPSFATDRLLYDPRFDSVSPAAVAYCASPTDVQRCVAFARAHGITPVPRCGGHSYGGYSTGTGLVIDVTPMNTVAVTGPSGADGTATAVVGAGTHAGRPLRPAVAAGVLVPAGSCPTVGISGLALGGGVGRRGQEVRPHV